MEGRRIRQQRRGGRPSSDKGGEGKRGGPCPAAGGEAGRPDGRPEDRREVESPESAPAKGQAHHEAELHIAHPEARSARPPDGSGPNDREDDGHAGAGPQRRSDRGVGGEPQGKDRGGAGRQEPIGNPPGCPVNQGGSAENGRENHRPGQSAQGADGPGRSSTDQRGEDGKANGTGPGVG